ncbi:MAG: RDD family protein [Verrucomicrobiota bacterium]
MDIWIIRDGEKVGPIHDYEIRRKIETGELPASTPAWHEGQPAWKPLAEIDIFTREFEIAAAPPEAAPSFPSPERATPPPLPVETFYGRRFWARWFDLTLYAGIWWLGMWAARQDIGAAWINPWIMLFHFIPWFVVETLLIHYLGTTPGKWLLSLQVRNKDGSPLDLPSSTRRSMRVLFTGIGFGWGLLAVFCQALSFFTARRLGTTLWDHAGGHQVFAAALSPFRVVTLVFLFFGALQMQMVVISPYVFELMGETFPALKKEYEKNPPWHLPKRSRTDNSPDRP